MSKFGILNWVWVWYWTSNLFSISVFPLPRAKFLISSVKIFAYTVSRIYVLDQSYMCGDIYCIYFVSFLPIILGMAAGSVLYLNGIPKPRALSIYSSVAYLIFSSNSVTNALIVLYRNKKSRQWLKGLVFFKCWRSHEDENNTSVVLSNIVHMPWPFENQKM